jgi:hypothetical protein
MRRGPSAAGRDEKLAIEQTSGRQRINIHGAINLETGQTRMIDVETSDALSTIRLLASIEALHPMLALIHVFLDSPGPVAGSSCIFRQCHECALTACPSSAI